MPDPARGGCDKPFHDPNDVNTGGPHGQSNAAADIAGGAVSGFVAQAEKARTSGKDVNNPACAGGSVPDVMGWHDAQEIPNYWTCAEDFVLQDHMFEPNASWSLPEHLLLVSEWSAHCTQHDNPPICTNALQNPGFPPDFSAKHSSSAGRGSASDPIYAWTDLTYLPHRDGVG